MPVRLKFGTTSIQHFLADLFLIHSDTDILNFADDNTPYLSAKNAFVIDSLEQSSVFLFTWFENNLLKGNANTCCFLVSTSQKVSLDVNNFKTKNSDCEKNLIPNLGLINIMDLCTRASRKIHALARVTLFMNLSNQCVLMNSFFKAQFDYCPLIWMSHSHESKGKINRLYEWCPRTVYNDKQSSFNELLEKDGSALIHEQNL